VERRVPSPAQPTPVVGTGALSESVVRAAGGFDKLINVALEVSVELGRTRVTLSEVLEFDVGSVVELDRAAGSPVDVRVNGTLLAQGEVVLIDDEYAVRITSIVEPGSEG
jgi:flagellar motor switch protein FliN